MSFLLEISLIITIRQRQDQVIKNLFVLYLTCGMVSLLFSLDSVTQETHTAVTRRLQSLEESESKLKVEVSRLKEVADVASHQTEAIKSQQESQDRELTSLRKQLYDMQMESDDKTIIGKYFFRYPGDSTKMDLR